MAFYDQMEQFNQQDQLEQTEHYDQMEQTKNYDQMEQFNQQDQTILNSTINYNQHEYNSKPYAHHDSINEKNYNLIGSTNSLQNQNISDTDPKYMERLIPNYTQFVPPRDPALEVGMSALPIKNMTILPNQIHNSLDLLKQTDQLNVSNFNKNSNYVTESKIINSNDVAERIENFQGVAQPFIPYPDHDKPNALLNNFINDGRLDLIKEYICHINSINRDVKKYPNPFNFLVQFNPSQDSIINNKTFTGNKDASISKTFTNIRYIKIETGVLPRKYNLTKKLNTNDPTIETLITTSSTPLSDNTLVPSTNWAIIYTNYTDNKRIINYTENKNNISDTITIVYESIYTISTGLTITYKYEISPYVLDDDKYSILYINDINDVSQFSTDQNLSQAFNVLYPDTISDNTVYVDCRYVDKIYKFSELGNMTRMLLRLTNSMGKDLTTNIKAQDNNVSTIDDLTCTCTTDSDGNYLRNYKCICSYIRHPRYIKNQLDLMFKLGIVETDFDKRPFN